jgi:hypothetical protein
MIGYQGHVNKTMVKLLATPKAVFSFGAKHERTIVHFGGTNLGANAKGEPKCEQRPCHTEIVALAHFDKAIQNLSWSQVEFFPCSK